MRRRAASLKTLDIYGPLLRSALGVLLVFGVGVFGYAVVIAPEHGWLDAIYMTVITLTTVGFGEIIDLSHNPAGRAFTMLLLIGGAGTFLSFFTRLTAFLVDGSIEDLLWRRAMAKRIERLEHHTIVCGGGHMGAHVARELQETERPFVVIEGDPDRAQKMVDELGNVPLVIGDATEDAILEQAAIGRASRLVSCISNDKDNLIVVVSARLLNPDLRIVCRCVEPKVERKILKAGADAVISPSRIGGLRMVSEAIRPTAVSFLDQMLRGTEEAVRVESTKVEVGSEAAGKVVADLGIDGLLLLAIQDRDGAWRYAPNGATPITAGESLVYLGGPAVRQAVEHQARGA